MTSDDFESIARYREQLDHCASSLSVARDQEVREFLPEGVSVDMVSMFTEGNLDKRIDKLGTQLKLLRDEIGDFDDHLEHYIHTIPLRAYETALSDGEQFLVWYSSCQALSPEHQDLVVCQRARHAVERIARKHRMEHLRFQELRSLPIDGDCSDPAQRYQLNPIRHEVQFQTNILLGDEDYELPADAVFFPVDDDVRTVVLEDIGKQIFELVSSKRVATVADLHRMLWEDPDVIDDTCRDLIEVGLAVQV